MSSVSSVPIPVDNSHMIENNSQSHENVNNKSLMQHQAEIIQSENHKLDHQQQRDPGDDHHHHNENLQKEEIIDSNQDKQIEEQQQELKSSISNDLKERQEFQNASHHNESLNEQNMISKGDDNDDFNHSINMHQMNKGVQDIENSNNKKELSVIKDNDFPQFIEMRNLNESFQQENQEQLQYENTNAGKDELVDENKLEDNNISYSQHEDTLYDNTKGQFQQLNDRLQFLNQKINSVYDEKQKNYSDDEILNYINMIQNREQNQVEINKLSNEISNDFIKERAYELLISYHSELILLRREKERDNMQINRLESTILQYDQQNDEQSLKLNEVESQLKETERQLKETQRQLKETETQLKEAQRLLSQQKDNKILTNLDDLSQIKQEQQSTELSNPFRMQQDKSQYSFDEQYKVNSFSEQLEQDYKVSIYDTQPIRKQEDIADDTYTSFNISPSTKKKVKIVQKLKDSFYGNKKRLSIRKDQSIQFEIPIKFNIHKVNPENNNSLEQNLQMRRPNQKIMSERGANKLGQILIEDNGQNMANINGINRYSLNTSKQREGRQISERENSFAIDNQYAKANDKYKSIIKQQKQFTINQNNSLWINSLDISDFLSQQNIKDSSKSLSNVKEDNQQVNTKVQNSYQPKIEKSRQTIKIISHQLSNPSQEDRQRIGGDRLPSRDKKVRKSYSIQSATNSKQDIHIISSKQSINNL